MLILLSPAKTLDYTKDFDIKPTAPAFLADSSKLIKELKTKEPKDIASLMGLSDNL
ncbi:YaaA family protein, partial [Gammaproteobacteria bacterium]|nr:YaaA family protein [Gammaproteobacteria bacterium]